MRRERGAKRPRDLRFKQILPGPLCGPFATQGRSYTKPRQRVLSGRLVVDLISESATIEFTS